jgi:hypothetical protein
MTAQEAPDWVTNGILAVESSSYYDGPTLVYVNQARGRHGERGPWQMTNIAWRDIGSPGRFRALQTDPAFARKCFQAYIGKLYDRAGSWELAVEWYNAGPRHRSPAYLRDVKRLGGR